MIIRTTALFEILLFYDRTIQKSLGNSTKAFSGIKKLTKGVLVTIPSLMRSATLIT